MTTTLPYFTAKARAVFAEAGGNPDNSGKLAQWAQAAREIGDMNRGVIVAEDGTIIAETKHLGGWAAAHYVTELHGDWDLGHHNEVGMAMSALRKHVGPTIHVRYWKVCTGSSAAIPEV